MRLLLDENLAPNIGRAMGLLVKDDGHEVVPLCDRFSRGTPDAEWIKALADEGGWTVVAFDRRITKRPHERETWLQSRIVLFVLENAWSKGIKPREQAARLLLSWPRLLSAFEAIAPPAAFTIPIRLNAKPRQLRGH